MFKGQMHRSFWNYKGRGNLDPGDCFFDKGGDQGGDLGGDLDGPDHIFWTLLPIPQICVQEKNNPISLLHDKKAGLAGLFCAK